MKIVVMPRCVDHDLVVSVCHQHDHVHHWGRSELCSSDKIRCADLEMDAADFVAFAKGMRDSGTV
jgi:hypothetical protein